MMYDVIVVGAGGIGSGALYHLAKRGARVLGLDRFPAGHNQGSSHGQTRIIRMAYFEHPDYVPLLRRAYELWSELESDCGERLYHQVGLLQAGPIDGEVVPGVLRSAEMHRLDVERLTSREMFERFPGFRAPDDFVAVFERQAGYLLVERCVVRHLELAEQRGAELRLDDAVKSWRREGDHIIVESERGRFATRRLILTAGPWAASLLPTMGVPLRVLRKHLHWFRSQSDDYRPTSGGCTFLFELPDGVYYGFPQVDGAGVKVAEHSGGVAVTDPRQDPRAIDLEDRQRVQHFTARCMPGVTQEATQHAVCFYTMSPDGHFLVDRHPADAGVFFVAGLSGHGFKFASVLGEALAQLALDNHSPLPLDFLSTRRLRPASP